MTLTYSTNSLSGATATGTAGTNTITTSVDVASSLAVGARIRLGSAGSVTTADTLGADTYTITAISGTTVTLSSNLTQTYTGSTLYRGLVSTLADKSGQANDATQATAANMPLWISNGQNWLGTIKFIETLLNTLTVNASVGGTTSASAFTSYAPFDSNFGILGTRSNDSYFRWIDGNGYIGTFRNLRIEAYPQGMPGSGSHIVSLTSSALAYEVFLDGLSKGSRSADYNAGNRLTLGQPNASGYYNGFISDAITYDTALSTNARNLVEQYQSAKWGIALTPPGTGATEVAKATASDGYSVFTTRYLERLSQSADISLQATNNINLDFKGDTLNFATSGRSLSLTAGNQITTASAGNITTNGGNITLAGMNGIVLNHAIGLTTNGGNLTLSNNTTLGANQSWNAGSGTMTFTGTVNGAYNLTATAGTFSLAQALGGTTPLSAVSLTSTNSLTLPSITASAILARTTGATADLTISTGKVLTASGSGTPLTLVSARNIINSADSGALSAPSGRWLVYSTNPGSDTLGGLSANFRLGSCSYGGSCPTIPGSGNGFLYSDSVSFTPISASEAARIQFAYQGPELATPGQSEPSYTKPRGNEESQYDSPDTSPQDLAPAQGQQSPVQPPFISVDPAAQTLFDLPPYL